jgi:hypothetical protein
VFDCPKENIPTLEMKIRKKYDLRFLEGFKALKKETPSKKRLEKGQKEGKEMSSTIWI